MNRWLEFAQHHPFLVAAVLILAVAAVVIEVRRQMQSATGLSPAEAVRLINSGALVLDVRNAEAYAGGHIIDARNIAEGELAAQADSLKKYREKPVLLYCDTGAVSAATVRVLKSLGFSKVVNLHGGLAAWKQDNLPTVTTPAKSGGKKGAQK